MLKYLLKSNLYLKKIINIFIPLYPEPHKLGATQVFAVFKYKEAEEHWVHFVGSEPTVHFPATQELSQFEH